VAFHCRDACSKFDIAVTLSCSVFVRLFVFVLALFLLKCCFDINHKPKKNEEIKRFVHKKSLRLQRGVRHPP